MSSSAGGLLGQPVFRTPNQQNRSGPFRGWQHHSPGCLVEALRSSPHSKRPGGDSIPYEFYKPFWDVVEAPLLAAITEMFADTTSSAALPQSMRQGIITLIFKGGTKDRRDPGSYRPITLLNTDYKLIAKVLAARIAGPLDTVIDVTQTAFLPGRQIGDNVMFHLEEVDFLEEVQESGCVLFLDFEKAFDRVNREWIHLCVQRMGFKAGTQRWIHSCCQAQKRGWLYSESCSAKTSSLGSSSQIIAWPLPLINMQMTQHCTQPHPGMQLWRSTSVSKCIVAHQPPSSI